ncbi:MAG: RdgB/HAM1 family non-canonical purine NTP pyrophosphatase [Spirochaetales bacterium]|nr:RdgB/HAM1 family non-canonical purine NTP pyrophosphatase [Spirochaetales bacterium]MCF7939735.1 RdgB/HAM1 family non-canonical purine NTP pyrophosphatase [Spirochaetales bacterium]
MDILLATNNPHKLTEMKAIFPEHRIHSPGEYGIEFHHEETGSTYLDNALGKARSLFETARKAGVHHPAVLADDSGLSVDALDGAPGILSARFGAEGGSVPESSEQNRLLLEKLKGIENRKAGFICCLALILSEYRVFTAQETLPGLIADAPRGKGGFGYDPILYLPGYQKTVAELPEEEKNRISHRGRAGAALDTLISGIETNEETEQ